MWCLVLIVDYYRLPIQKCNFIKEKRNNLKTDLQDDHYLERVVQLAGLGPVCVGGGWFSLHVICGKFQVTCRRRWRKFLFQLQFLNHFSTPLFGLSSQAPLPIKHDSSTIYSPCFYLFRFVWKTRFFGGWGTPFRPSDCGFKTLKYFVIELTGPSRWMEVIFFF